MRQSYISETPKSSIDRPPCPKCGWPMWLAHIEPSDKPDYDKQTFDCPRCEHQEQIEVTRATAVVGDEFDAE